MSDEDPADDVPSVMSLNIDGPDGEAGISTTGDTLSDNVEEEDRTEILNEILDELFDE